MTITFLGKQLNASIEHKLQSTNELGFTVVVRKRSEEVRDGYTGDGRSKFFTIPEHIIVYHNVTEVHSRYRELPGQARIAFESDIQLTGGTREIDLTESVVITESKRLYKSYFGLFIEY